MSDYACCWERARGFNLVEGESKKWELVFLVDLPSHSVAHVAACVL